MITDRQLVDIILNIVRTKIPENARILTNSRNVLITLNGIYKSHNFDRKNIFFISADKEEATIVYESDELSDSSVFFSTPDEFAKNHRRSFDCILFYCNGASNELLDLFTDTVINGAKDGCITCFILSYDNIDDEISKKVNEISENICKVHNSSLSDSQKFDILINSTSIISASMPWVSSSSKKATDEIKRDMVNSPECLLLPIEDGELPFLGIKNNAMLSYFIRYTAIRCVSAKSFQVPNMVVCIDDGKFSTGIAYISKTYRSPTTSISHKTYQSKCQHELKWSAPPLYLLTGDSRLKVVTNTLPINTPSRLEYLTNLLLRSNAELKNVDKEELAKKMASGISLTISPLRINEIFKEFILYNLRNDEDNKKELTNEEIFQKLSSYSEFEEFIKTVNNEAAKILSDSNDGNDDGN